MSPEDAEAYNCVFFFAGDNSLDGNLSSSYGELKSLKTFDIGKKTF